MKVKLKKLKDQVIVITGASSGIGLTTARKAAQRGAKLVLAARSEDALRQVENELSGVSEVVTVVADVAREDDVRSIAEAAMQRFGRFDTWVNNAGVSVYGRSLDVPIEDQRKLFETNFWGVVYGSHVAAEHLRREGGAIINLGSVVSDRAMPLQGAYSASKAAIKAYTDTLRMELEEERAPISLTLIQPTGIDTPFPQHAKNYMEAEPRLPEPVYSPDIVADVILQAAQQPIRHMHIGGGAKQFAMMASLAPRFTDKFMEKSMFKKQKRDEPAGYRRSSLDHPSEDLRERGDHDGPVKHTSLYTASARRPMTTAVVALGAGVAVAALVAARRASHANDIGEAM